MSKESEKDERKIFQESGMIGKDGLKLAFLGFLFSLIFNILFESSCFKNGDPEVVKINFAVKNEKL